MGKVIWTEKASSHVQGIQGYISRDSKTYATRFVKALVGAAAKLALMPRLGRIVPELESSGYREVLFQNYRIVYKVTANDDVVILAVMHAARNFRKAFGAEWEL